MTSRRNQKHCRESSLTFPSQTCGRKWAACGVAHLAQRGAYAVIEANSAAEAIQVLKNGLEVAVVFTDIRMPGTVDGMDLARYVQSHHPHIPVVITSGHVLPKEVPGSLGAPFIAKPYDRALVLETIEQQLRQREEK